MQIIGLLGIFLTSMVHASDENETFDRFRDEPNSIIRAAYEKKKILFLAESNHSNFRSYRYLETLLSEIKNDSRLKYIVLERHGNLSGFYSDLSEFSLKDTISKGHSIVDQYDRYEFCLSHGWAYSIKNLFPMIREINKTRKADRKLKVITIDGMEFQKKKKEISSDAKLIPKGCELESRYFYDRSVDREDDTKINFVKKLWKQLKGDDKAIVFYHIGHLLSDIDACTSRYIDFSKWKTQIERFSWFGRVAKDHLEIRKNASVVLIDEEDQSYQPTGILEFTRRHAERYPRKAFGIDLRHFSKVELETASSMFRRDGSLYNMFEGSFSSEKRLDEIIDFVVWTPNASEHFKLAHARHYLPKYCSNIP